MFRASSIQPAVIIVKYVSCIYDDAHVQYYSDKCTTVLDLHLTTTSYIVDSAFIAVAYFQSRSPCSGCDFVGVRKKLSY